MTRLLCLAAMVIAISVATFADVPRPDVKTEPKPKGYLSNIEIRLDRTATEARLLIPKSQLKQLRAELEQIDADNNTAAGTFTSLQTVVSGLFLSLAIVFGGLWFSGRGTPRPGKAVVAAGAVIGVVVAASFVYANIAPPPAARTLNGSMFSQSMQSYGYGYGKVRVETTDTTQIVLVVPNPQEGRPNE